MTRHWKVAVLAGAIALGTTLTSVRAQQDAGGQQAAQQERRGRGQGRGGAGGGGFGVRNPTEAVEQLKTQVFALNLNDDQKTKLEAIFKEQADKAKTLASEVENLQGRERAEKLMPFQREMREKVTGVLTDEQKTTLRKNQAERTAKQMTERYRRALADLGLSSEQKGKTDALLDESEKKYAAAIAEAGPGGPGGGAGGPGGGVAGGGPFREINQDLRQKINDILTPDQQAKLREALPQGPRGGGQGRGNRGQGNNNQN